MKCESCGEKISPNFKFAWVSNLCPCCGQPLIVPEKLPVYKEVVELISQQDGNLSSEGLANALLVKFDMRLRTSVPEEKVITAGVGKAPDSEKTADELSDDEYKKNQLAEARRIKKLRDEALDGALAEQWGLGEGVFTGGAPDTGIQGYVGELKKEKSQEAFKSGAGVFKRSGE